MSRAPALRALLERFVPADSLEAGHRAAMLTLLGAPDPFARDHWVPGHFTASAFVLSPDGRDLLLIFHEKFRRWLQPGGHVEPEDVDLVAAARREVEEETGVAGVELVDGLFDVDVHDIPARKGDPPHQHFDVRVLLRAPTREFNAGSDALAARWVPLQDVAGIETDESVLRAVRKLHTRRAAAASGAPDAPGILD
jgi:ADP-ribose pyrophosphatase YjhB (NUDIX family)